MATPTQIKRRGRWSLIFGTLFAAALFAAVAYADNVQNDVVVGGNDTFTAGGSTTVNYRITANNGDGQTGCNAADTSPATVTINPPVGVTANPTSLSFTSCGTDKPVTFSSNTTGDYEVSVTVSDSGTGTYNTNPAKLTLHVESILAPDADGDGVPDASDNCPYAANTNQANADGDSLGNACDSNSYAPAAGTLNSAGASGDEGDTLGASGSFTDGDGNGTVTITQTAGLGTVAPGANGTWTWSLATTDQASGSVTIEATDNEHAVATQTFSWSAVNVAPTASIMGGPSGTSPEGTEISLGSSVSDPSSADTAAGFTYSWSVTRNGSAYGTGGSGATFSFTPNDDGTYVVSFSATDKDGAVGSATAKTIAVTNIAPTASISGGPSGTSPEGTQISLGSSVTDPSSADTAAGFTYSWSVTRNGSAYGTGGSGATFSFTPNDDGTYVVSFSATDKDGAVGSATARTIAVTNVNPAFDTGKPAFAAASVSCTNRTVTLNFGFSDAGSADTHTGTVDWGDGAGAQSLTSAEIAAEQASHTYANSGSYTAIITVTDDDLGSTGPRQATQVVQYNLSSILQPINDTRNGQTTSMFKYGSTIPVKVEITDCAGAHPDTLNVFVRSQVTASNPPPVGTDEPYSTSAADTGNQMRFSSPLYIFNLASKSLTSDSTATVRIDVWIPATNQISYAHIGLKSK